MEQVNGCVLRLSEMVERQESVSRMWEVAGFPRDGKGPIVSSPFKTSTGKDLNRKYLSDFSILYVGLPISMTRKRVNLTSF